MDKMLNRKLYIIPAVYLLLACLFFFIHFSQREKFSQTLGNIELSGLSTKGTLISPPEIKKLTIRVNGMNFQFGSRSGIKMITADDITHHSNLLDFEVDEDSFTLSFENRISLIFKTDYSDNKTSIVASLPKTAPPVREIILPFGEDDGYSLGFTEEDNTPVISNGEARFFIALANEYHLNPKEGTISISAIDGEQITFVIQETLVSKGRTAEKWYGQYNGDLTSDYTMALATYINNAYFGWNSRFNSKTGMWTDGDGVQRFDEKTAASYLSESLVRGSYKTSANLIRTASVNLENELTASTAPYLGNIVVKGRELINHQRREKQRLLNLIDQNDSALLETENLVSFLQNNNMDSYIETILRRAFISRNGEETRDSVFRLKFISDSYNLFSSDELNPVMTDIIENSILPAVTWLDEGLYLESDKTISFKDSFKAGKELLRAGQILENDFYLSVGRQMIISILERAGEAAFLPETALIHDHRITNETGTLLPEEIYYELSENPFYSKQEPLSEILGPGSWMLTTSDDYSLTTLPGETIVNISFPKGSMHHFAIKGIKPFERVYIYGIKWNSDPNFERYSDGWVYDRANETLYVKLKNRTDIEKVRILYYNPDATPASETNKNDEEEIDSGAGN